MKISDIADNKWYEIPPGWDWLHMLPGWTYRKMIGYLPYHREIYCNKTRSSRELAIKMDNICTGLFHYRDFTENGMPFIYENETYRAVFDFELTEDLVKFEKLMNETNG